MCLIIDTNRFSDFLADHFGNFKPVRKWIESNGKLVYSPTTKIKNELQNHSEMLSWCRGLRQSEKLKIIEKSEVNQVKNKLTNLVSDDPDIVALAIVSKAKLLVSGDKNLHSDFKKFAGGKIYQNKTHSHLLRGYKCP